MEGGRRHQCPIARTGYTGEPGVELIRGRATPSRCSTLLRSEHGVVPCGLGARDTLRLEVCYPLHGNDISPETNAIEAGLGWVCALDKDFIGADVLRAQGPRGRGGASWRCACWIAPSRARAPLLHEGGRSGRSRAGRCRRASTAGSASAIFAADLAAPGSVVQVDVRGRARDAEVAQKPLYRKET